MTLVVICFPVCIFLKSKEATCSDLNKQAIFDQFSRVSFSIISETLEVYLGTCQTSMRELFVEIVTNTQFFPVRIFPHLENTDQKKLCIWTLSTQWFHQRYLTKFLVRLWISFIFFYRLTQRPYFCFGIRMENSSSFYRCSIFDNTLQHQKPRTEKIR